jgi:beta-glucosidase
MAYGEFPEGFLWGAATAAYQIEGAAREGGRGESIWDRFCRIPGAIEDQSSGDAACDHYHRWRDDLDNMKALGLKAYRFSIAWPRIFPGGKGTPNAIGMDFYSRLVDALLADGIQPAVTLYHWDLPQALQDRGGWTNRDTAHYFADYSDALFKALADRVKIWITLNEPQAQAWMGYANGAHAPGIRDFGQYVQVVHGLMLAHALSMQAYRQENPGGGRIGITLSFSTVYPLADSEEDAAAAGIANAFHNRYCLDPVLRAEYPPQLKDLYAQKHVAPHTHAGDFELLRKYPPDFLGVNYYFPFHVFRSEDHHPILGFHHKPAEDRPKTEMGWEIYPKGIYDLLMWISRDYGNPVMMVTENGMACRDDRMEGGQIQDTDRIDYLRSHLLEVRNAIRDGVRLEGYFVWSLMDNFEWALGYTKRFGLTHVDYRTQKRTWKRSANWYQKVIDTNGASLEE